MQIFLIGIHNNFGVIYPLRRLTLPDASADAGRCSYGIFAEYLLYQGIVYFEIFSQKNACVLELILIFCVYL